MASTTPQPLIYHSIALLLFLPFATAVTATQRGFSLELIPPFSDRSPFYPGNLTHSQRLKWLVQSSETHLRWLESIILGPNTTDLRPPLLLRGLNYVVKLRIGTGMKSQLLCLDTGSSLTWIQCQPCSPCFPQPDRHFTASKSRTYQALPSDDARCVHPYGPGQQGRCAYHQAYADGTFSYGDLSTETFTFQSDNNNRPEAIPGLIFGCGRSNHFPHKNGDWTGVMGMGTSPVSIPMQLGHETGGRFSYCLVRQGLSGPPTFLRFGNNYEMTRHFHRTPISIFPENDHYYLTLIDVSFGGDRLGLSGSFFTRRADRSGGFIIDSGASMSRMIRPAYDQVSTYLDEYFREHHLLRVSNCRPPFELCYSMPTYGSLGVLPSMTLRLEGADLPIRWESTYLEGVENHCFCWAMLPSDHFTILGAYQQADIRFVFDVGARVLWFDHEECEDDGHHN